MSRENVEAIRALFAAFSHKAPPAQALATLDPECEIQDFPGLVGAEWHHGHEGAIQWAGNLWQVFSELHVEPTDFKEVESDRLIVTYRAVGLGRRSGGETTLSGYAVFSMRDGRVLRASAHRIEDEALQAAGLLPEKALLVRRGLEAFARRDLPAWLECFDPSVAVHEDPFVPDAGAYRGHDGLLKWLHVMERNWDEFHVRGEAFAVVGDDVVTLVSVQGRGRGSGIDIEGRFGSVFTVRSDRVVNWQIYASWQDTLRVTGLRDEDLVPAGSDYSRPLSRRLA